LTAGGASSAAATQEQTRVTLNNAQVDALFNLQRMHERDGSEDLLAIGIGAIGALIGGMLLDR
jgi:hypothetical protein